MLQLKLRVARRSSSTIFDANPILEIDLELGIILGQINKHSQCLCAAATVDHDGNLSRRAGLEGGKCRNTS